MNSNFDVALESALDKEFSWLDNFENPYSGYVFSARFEKSMDKVISKASYSYVSIGRKRIRRAFIAVLIALLSLAIAGCAAAIHYITWHEKDNPQQGTLDVHFDIDGELRQDTDKSDLPSTPEGFTITEQYTDEYSTIISYENSQGELIGFSQCEDVENMGLSIDNEDADFEETAINGYKGYSYFKDGLHALFWTDGIRFYVLQGTCDADILYEMAKSMVK